MTNPDYEQPGVHPAHGYAQRGHSVGFFFSGFSTGFLTAILGSTLAYFLVIKPNSQNAATSPTSNASQTVAVGSNPQTQVTNSLPSVETITAPANQNQDSQVSPLGSAIDSPSSSVSSTLSNQSISRVGPRHSLSGLNLEEQHPNGTSLRVNRVSLNPDSIAVHLAVTNSHHGKIKLNELWASRESTMILQDNLGNEYRVAPPPENQEIEVEPGKTTQGEFIFLGSVGPSAHSLTLTTNSRGGLLHNSITNKPKISVQIPLNQY